MSIGPLVADNRRAILDIAEANGATRVRIFGSAARGTIGPDSDIDLLVDLAIGRHLLDLVAIKQDIEASLGRRVHVVTEAAVSPYVREDVVRSAILL